MRHLAPLLLALTLALPGCDHSTEVLEPVSISEPFELRIGETVLLRERQWSIRLGRVLEDSRCPTDSLNLCVWAGRVRLQLATASLSGDEALHEVHLGDEPTILVLGDLRLELLEVSPAARLDRIPDAQYRARFVLTLAR